MPVKGSSFIRFEDSNAQRNYLLFPKIIFISRILASFTPSIQVRASHFYLLGPQGGINLADYCSENSLLIQGVRVSSAKITTDVLGKRKGCMKKKIIILDANQKSSAELCKILGTKSYPVSHGSGLSLLENDLATGQYVAVVLDIDTIPIDNRTIRELAIKYPAVRFLCTSKDRFHPELKDAICYHIYACLNKPVDPDELLFWIKSIYEEDEIPDT